MSKELQTFRCAYTKSQGQVNLNEDAEVFVKNEGYFVPPRPLSIQALLLMHVLH